MKKMRYPVFNFFFFIESSVWKYELNIQEDIIIPQKQPEPKN